MVEHKIVRTDEFFCDDGIVSTERIFGGCSVILCTLSTLSNPIIDISGLTTIVPVERLVIDEASQIDIFEFLVRDHR